MGESLYLYLEENNLLDDLANVLVVERNVSLLKKEKTKEDAYFEGSRYFDNTDFRKHLDCYKYTYCVSTVYKFNNEIMFSHLEQKQGLSIEEERPHGVYGSKYANCLYNNAEGSETVVYQKTMEEEPSYKLKHVSYIGSSKEKVFKLPSTLKSLLENDDDFAMLIIKKYNINLNSYNSELLRRKEIFNKISMIDKQIIQLEKLKNDYLNQLSYGKSK